MSKRAILAASVFAATALIASPAAADGHDQSGENEAERFAWYDASEGAGATGVLLDELDRLTDRQTPAQIAALSQEGAYLGGVDEDFNLVAVLPYPDDIVPYGADVSVDGTTRQEQAAAAAAEGWTSSRAAHTAPMSYLGPPTTFWGGCLGDTAPYAAEIKVVGSSGKWSYTCWDGRGTNNENVEHTNQWCAGSYSTTYWFGSTTDAVSATICHQFLDPLTTDTVTKASR